MIFLKKGNVLEGLEPISDEKLSEMGRHMRRIREERTRKERQEQESITLPVGTHAGCGGQIIYRSWFEIAVPLHHIRFGGRNPMREETSCSCDKCGQMFDPYFKAYRNQVVAHRKR